MAKTTCIICEPLCCCKICPLVPHSHSQHVELVNVLKSTSRALAVFLQTTWTVWHPYEPPCKHKFLPSLDHSPSPRFKMSCLSVSPSYVHVVVQFDSSVQHQTWKFYEEVCHPNEWQQLYLHHHGSLALSGWGTAMSSQTRITRLSTKRDILRFLHPRQSPLLKARWFLPSGMPKPNFWKNMALHSRCLKLWNKSMWI